MATKKTSFGQFALLVGFAWVGWKWLSGDEDEGAAIGGKYDKDAFQYILNSIDCSGYGVKCNTDWSKLVFLNETFKSEYGWAIKQYGKQKAFREWIMGLPSSFNIEFENYKILQLAKKWGSLPANATERQEDKILDNYWNFITAKTFQLFSKYGIE